jgi:hypothetical protein
MAWNLCNLILALFPFFVWYVTIKDLVRVIYRKLGCIIIMLVSKIIDIVYLFASFVQVGFSLDLWFMVSL